MTSQNTSARRMRLESKSRCKRGDLECPFMTVGFQGFLYDLLDDCRRDGILIYLRIVWDFGGFNSDLYRIRVLNFIISRYIEL